jgi:uncharacterized protein
MKKVIAIILTLVLVVGITACGAPTPEPAPTETEENPAVETPVEASSVNLSLGGASLGGNFFSMGAAMAAVIIDTTGYRTTAQATGGSAFNVDAVHNKEIDIGMSQANVIASAVNGTDQFEGFQVDDIRTLFNYNATPIHILVRTSLGINDITELGGARIECISPGDGIELSTQKILPILGLPIEDVKLEYSGNRVQAASRLKTGQVDAILDATGVGAAWMTDVIGDGSDFILLSLTNEQMDILTGEFSEMSIMRIPAGTYGGQDEEVVTVGNWTTVFVHEDLDEEVAYNIVKAIFENKENLIKAHSFFTDLEPENVIDAAIAPLHPGAERYYQEIGIN